MEWILGLLGILVPWIITAQNNNQNKSYLEEANAKNEALMREGWERDDYALDRQVEALKRNGMSPLLATPGGMNSSSPIQIQSYKQNNDLGSILGNAMDLFSFGNLYKQQKLEFDSKKLDNDYKEKTIEYLQKQIDHFGESPDLKNLEYMWSKLEEHWPAIADAIKNFGNWSGETATNPSPSPRPTPEGVPIDSEENLVRGERPWLPSTDSSGPNNPNNDSVIEVETDNGFYDLQIDSERYNKLVKDLTGKGQGQLNNYKKRVYNYYYKLGYTYAEIDIIWEKALEESGH